MGDQAARLAAHCRDRLAEHHAYIREHGEDMPEIRSWRWEGAAPDRRPPSP
jgi:xylulose-5-phosphate/fructose-6-phosphate phosphoketolase